MYKKVIAVLLSLGGLVSSAWAGYDWHRKEFATITQVVELRLEFQMESIDNQLYRLRDQKWRLEDRLIETQSDDLTPRIRELDTQINDLERKQDALNQKLLG